MPILNFQRDRGTVHGRADELAVAEIEKHRLEGTELEAHLFFAQVVSAFGVRTNATRYLTSEIAAARCRASSRGMPRGACAKRGQSEEDDR